MAILKKKKAAKSAPDKVVAKQIKDSVPKSKKQTRYVHVNNVDKRKKEGWKIVTSKVSDDKGKTLAVRTNTEELVLMEK